LNTVSIIVEIDTNPPAGAGLETSIIRKYRLMNILHYDKSSLFAGKLHALLSRNYLKGRDVYDLMWYLSDRSWPEPNLVLLNNALVQTGWGGVRITDDNWKSVVSEHLCGCEWRRVIEDVRPLLEDQREAEMLTEANLMKLLRE
jgi:hypothetical protein